MPKLADSKFRRGIAPLGNVFRPGARPEAYAAAASYAPCADILNAKGAGLVHRHRRPHQVFACAISGRWGDHEHEWIATAGDFVYESPGEGHTLIACEHEDPMRAFLIVTGASIRFDENGEAAGHFDVFDDMQMCRDHHESVGLGAALIDDLVR